MKVKKIASWLLLGLLAVPLIYVAIQTVQILHRPYLTTTVVRDTLADSIQLDGVVCFEQQMIPGSGQVGYLVKSGERVSAGVPVAELYENDQQAHGRSQINALQHQIELLERSQNASGTDVGVQLAQVQAALYDLLDGLDRQRYAQVQKSRDQYLIAANKMQIMTGKAQNFTQAISELSAQKDEITAQVGTPQPVTAPTGGYFVAAADAQYLNVPSEELAQMSAGALQQQLQAGMQTEGQDVIGKIVTSYHWQFYTVCSAQQAQRFSPGMQVAISFPGKAKEPRPAKVLTVEEDKETGLFKIVIDCEYIGSEILDLGQETAQIDFAAYKGLRISAQALHIVDNAKGVYVKYGNLAKFRKIKILYQNEDYIIVPPDGRPGTENEVRLFDEVIVQGTDLYDGKLL